MVVMVGHGVSALETFSYKKWNGRKHHDRPCHEAPISVRKSLRGWTLMERQGRGQKVWEARRASIRGRHISLLLGSVVPSLLIYRRYRRYSVLWMVLLIEAPDEPLPASNRRSSFTIWIVNCWFRGACSLPKVGVQKGEKIRGAFVEWRSWRSVKVFRQSEGFPIEKSQWRKNLHRPSFAFWKVVHNTLVENILQFNEGRSQSPRRRWIWMARSLYALIGGLRIEPHKL